MQQVSTGNDGLLDSLREENRRLKRAVEELSVLNDLARAIGASLDSQQIMGSIVRRSLRAINAEQGVITLVEDRPTDPTRTLIRAMASSSQHEQFHLHNALLGWMQLNKKPLAMNDPLHDDRFRGVKWDSSIQTLLCVPLMIKSELKGVLTVYNKKGVTTGFTEDDQRLLAIIAGQSAQVVENARLNERERQLTKMQEEVRLAARIQSDLLPQTMPELPGYSIAGRNIPAQVVGGDHFDFIPVDADRMAICLGDVSGKGLPASLLMANLQATLRSQTLNLPSPKDCIERSNRLLFQSTSSEKFVTLFYCVVNYSTHDLSFTNAGHDFPYLLGSDGSVRRLETGGLALGMLEDFPFQEETVHLTSGDLLAICSDGVSEAMNTAEERFGDVRVEEVLKRCRDLTPDAIIGKVVEAVKEHAGSAPQMDDITMVVLKRL